MKYRGFTIPEILITLVIIGVVATMTISTLIQRQHDREIVSKLEKTYSILSQAALYAQNEHGNVETWNFRDNSQPSTREIFSYFEPYLKIIKKCDNKAGCWGKTTKSLSGQISRWSGNESFGVDYIDFTLADGTNVVFDFCGTNLDFFGLPAADMETPFILFYTDLNGNKAPNTHGRDIFTFALSKKGLIPLGIANNSANCNKSIQGDTSGFACAYKVLQEKAINY